MSDFADQVRAFSLKVETRNADVFKNVVSATLDSIVNGSAVTGSPGQPVGQYGPGYHPGEVGGALKTSWTMELDSPTSPTSAIIGTNSPYAVQNEYGISATNGPYVQHSSVGGRHSVAHTVAGFGLIVADAVAKAAT
jgi:phage gpG-like protein